MPLITPIRVTTAAGLGSSFTAGGIAVATMAAAIAVTDHSDLELHDEDQH
jgi:hypothetical protein